MDDPKDLVSEKGNPNSQEDPTYVAIPLDHHGEERSKQRCEPSNQSLSIKLLSFVAFTAFCVSRDEYESAEYIALDIFEPSGRWLGV